jgi:tripeptide aminopeptidase
MQTIPEILQTPYAERLLERFLCYVKTWTTSIQETADKGIMPSSSRQLDFARILRDELLSIGITDVQITEYGYVCARIPATRGYEHTPAIGFLAHMDTVAEVSGENVQPQVIRNYAGTNICLKDSICLDPATDLPLRGAVGDTLVTTDGTTLLGADDKAGLAEIMTAAETILSDPAFVHGCMEFVFSPDEETGHGMDKVPLEWFQSRQCYTLDGGHVGELEIECFNAWKSEITFTGLSRHTGTARPDMVNAVTMAADFVSMLPRNESPETTDGYQGFFAPMEITGHIESASVILYLRDFNLVSMEHRLETITILAKAIERKFNGGSVTVIHSKQYLNMKETMDHNPDVVATLVQAVENCGIVPVFKPIRGGTDGSRLTEMGIPTPNIFTGGHNFHSRAEWASLSQMILATETIRQLAKLWAEKQ